MTNAGFQLITTQAVDSLTMFIGIAQREMAAEMTFNQQRALNAAGCAVDNLGTNFWNFVAAVYYLFRQFGEEKQIEDKLNEYYPYVCTC